MGMWTLIPVIYIVCFYGNTVLVGWLVGWLVVVVVVVAVVFTTAPQYNLRSEMTTPPAVLLLFGIVQAALFVCCC